MLTSVDPLGYGYESWVSCAIGSFVVIENVAEMPIPGFEALRAGAENPEHREDVLALLYQSGMDLATGIMTVTNRTTLRLVELTPAAATLQNEITTSLHGAPVVHRILQVLPAKPEPVVEGRQVWTSGTAEEGALVERVTVSSLPDATPPVESEERLVVAGQDLLCRCTEKTSEMMGKPFWMKTWLSDRIPGGVALRHLRIGPDAAPLNVTRMTVTSFEKKQGPPVGR